MATTKDYIDFILQQLSDLREIACQSMMGEYIIYYRGKIAAYVCDNRFLVKPVAAAVAKMESPVFEPPYKGAKNMLLVKNINDKAFLTQLFETMYDELPEPKPKKKN